MCSAVGELQRGGFAVTDEFAVGVDTDFAFCVQASGEAARQLRFINGYAG